jgi:hypothetical protein
MAAQEDQQEEQAQLIERAQVLIAANRMAARQRGERRRLTDTLNKGRLES